MFSCFGAKKLASFDSFCEVKEVLLRNFPLFRLRLWRTMWTREWKPLSRKWRSFQPAGTSWSLVMMHWTETKRSVRRLYRSSKTNDRSLQSWRRPERHLCKSSTSLMDCCFFSPYLQLFFHHFCNYFDTAIIKTLSVFVCHCFLRHF